ncbi:hypothetical protein LV779_13205 [Streptomyces thinghirensis]|nr:hypothetical protein [Streptomyces thinghirensis]
MFAEEFEDAPKKLRKLKKSYGLAGDALATFWPDLQDAQEKADKALRDGRKAREELTTAQTALSGANDWVRTATEKVDSYDPAKNGGKDVPKPDEGDVRRATRDAQHANARQAATERNVESAQSALEAAKKLAGQAKGLREEAARRTVTKLKEASDAGIPNRHWWEEIGDWVSDHWDEIVTICKWVVAIAGIIVMIVGGPLGWLVFAAALVVMADTIRKVLQGQAGWGDLLWAALDCIPATKGFHEPREARKAVEGRRAESSRRRFHGRHRWRPQRDRQRYPLRISQYRIDRQRTSRSRKEATFFPGAILQGRPPGHAGIQAR